MTTDYPLHMGEVMVHEKTGTRGKVSGTLYPNNSQLQCIMLTLTLKDGSEKEFPYIELREATKDEESEFGSAESPGNE